LIERFLRGVPIDSVLGEEGKNFTSVCKISIKLIPKPVLTMLFQNFAEPKKIIPIIFSFAKL